MTRLSWRVIGDTQAWKFSCHQGPMKQKNASMAVAAFTQKGAREEDSVPFSILPQWGDVSAAALPTWSLTVTGPERTFLPARARPNLPKPKAEAKPKPPQGKGKAAAKKRSPSRQPGKAKAKAKVSTAEASAGHIEIDWASFLVPPLQVFTMHAPSMPLFTRPSTPRNCQMRTVCWLLSWTQELHTPFYP